MKRLKQVIYNILIRFLDLCKRNSSLYSGVNKPKKASFKIRQLIQHGNAGNNLPGRSGLCSNTLPLYDHVIKTLGFKMVECDVRMTSDSIPVLCHDPFINRVATRADGTMPANPVYVNQCTYEGLQNYCFGKTKISTLDELLSLCRQNDVICFIDVNCDVTSDNVKIIFDSIQRNDMLDRVFIEPKINSGVELFMELDKEHRLSYQLDKVFSIEGIDSIDKLGYKEKAKNLIISKSIIKPSLRDRIIFLFFPRLSIEFESALEDTIVYGHNKEYIMKVTTINEAYLAKYFFKIGIDLICTDCLLFEENYIKK